MCAAEPHTPITAYDLVCGHGKCVAWYEDMNGDSTILVHSPYSKQTVVLAKPPFIPGSQVYGYGGGALAVSRDEIFLTDHEHGSIWKYKKDYWSRLTTPELGRFADLSWAEDQLLAVRELQDQHDIVAIDTKSGALQLVCHGADFYAAPRLSPDGENVAWLEWNHPSMPFTATRLYRAAINNGVIDKPHLIAGAYSESITQPTWGPEGNLYWLSDRDGFWQLHTENRKIIAAPFDHCRAPWKLGAHSYCLLDNTIAALRTEAGTWSICLLNLPSKEETVIKLPFTEYDALYHLDDSLFVIAGGPEHRSTVIQIDLESYHYSFVPPLAQEKPKLSINIVNVEAVQTTTSQIPGLLYRKAYSNKALPLVISCHGGPTSMARSSYDLRRNELLNAGFQIFDLNYRGSSGYGKAYRSLLDHNWGLFDVEDVVLAAQELCRAGFADQKSLFISGASAGGFTALATITKTNLFRGCVSYYGISDLTTLCTDTHKFERHYLERLVPMDEQSLRARSPLYQIHNISTPTLFLQGAKDGIVPPQQSLQLLHQLQKQNVIAHYIEFADEGHGFTRSENVKKAAAREIQFYRECLKV